MLLTTKNSKITKHAKHDNERVLRAFSCPSCSSWFSFSRHTPKSGFTLIELSVAMALVTVVLGLVIVRVSGWTSRQALHASARALGNTIRMYREKAQFEERVYSLTLVLDEGLYRVTEPPERGAYTTTIPNVVRSGRLRADQMFGEILVGEQPVRSPVTLDFTPRGITPETKITLQNNEKETVTLTVSAFVNEVGYEDVQ
jgi:prepilin-type N-terminal cleavage/methylation domain-containing protein